MTQITPQLRHPAENSGLRIFARHCQGPRFCVQGVRVFAKQHGFDYKDFVRRGIDADELIALNDKMAMDVVNTAWNQAVGTGIAKLLTCHIWCSNGS